jgi:TPR repeat protein
MTPAKTNLLLVFSVLSGILMATADANPPAGDQPVAGVQDLQLRAKEIPKLKRDALSGSGEAALRLSSHFEFAALDAKQADYWLAIAAENGDPTAQVNYAYALARRGSASDKLRANFWARRALDSGKNIDAARAFLNENHYP